MMSGAMYREGDGRYSSEDPDGRGHLSTGPDRRDQQTAYSRHLSRLRTVVLPAPVGSESPGPDSGTVLSVWRGKRQWTASGRLAGKLALYRAGEAQPSGVARRGMAHRAQPFPPTDLRPRSRRGCG